MQVKIIQTSDPVKYLPILEATQRVNKLYSKLHEYDYYSFKGIIRGNSPIHAAFNRVFLLSELVLSGYSGWVAYLDADAFFSNLYFDLSDYLHRNSGHCFIAARASTDARKWAINNGVFFVNLGNPLGVKLVECYRQRVEQLVPADYWEDSNADWPPSEYDDQNILFSILASDEQILTNMKNESEAVFNAGGKSAISQLLRAMYTNFEERLSSIEISCDKTINDFIMDINPLLMK